MPVVLAFKAPFPSAVLDATAPKPSPTRTLLIQESLATPRPPETINAPVVLEVAAVVLVIVRAEALVLVSTGCPATVRAPAAATFPALSTLSLLAPPTCKSNSKLPDADAVSVMLDLMPVKTTAPAFQVWVKL